MHTLHRLAIDTRTPADVIWVGANTSGNGIPSYVGWDVCFFGDGGSGQTHCSARANVWIGQSPLAGFLFNQIQPTLIISQAFNPSNFLISDHLLRLFFTLYIFTVIQSSPPPIAFNPNPLACQVPFFSHTGQGGDLGRPGHTSLAHQNKSTWAGASSSKRSLRARTVVF